MPPPNNQYHQGRPSITDQRGPIQIQQNPMPPHHFISLHQYQASAPACYNTGDQDKHVDLCLTLLVLKNVNKYKEKHLAHWNNRVHPYDNVTRTSSEHTQQHLSPPCSARYLDSCLLLLIINQQQEFLRRQALNTT